MRHVNLEPIGAVVELLAGGFARFHGAVDELRALGDLDLRSVAFEWIASRGRDGAGNSEDARAGNAAFVDGLPNADIAIAGAFRLDIANGGEALLHRSMRGHHRASSS